MLAQATCRRCLCITRGAALSLLIVALSIQSLVQATQKQTVTSGKRSPRLVIRNAMVVDGNGTPASGPKDIVIEGNTIAEIVPLDPVALRDGRAKRPAGDVEIDASGKYVLPGLINAHGHVQCARSDRVSFLRLSGRPRLGRALTPG